jgi:hypothetical protein
LGLFAGLENGGALLPRLILCSLVKLGEHLAFQDLPAGVLVLRLPSSDARVSILRRLVDGQSPARFAGEIRQHLTTNRRLGLVLSLIKVSLIKRVVRVNHKAVLSYMIIAEKLMILLHNRPASMDLMPFLVPLPNHMSDSV